MTVYQDSDAVADRFRHHPPAGRDVVAVHELVRHLCTTLALQFNQVLPDCEEARAAIDAVGLAAMHANAAITRLLDSPGQPRPAPEPEIFGEDAATWCAPRSPGLS